MRRRERAGRSQPGFMRRDSLSRRLALALLPMVLLPILIMGGVAYLRSRAILEQQARSEMASATESQIQVLSTWAKTREQQLVLASQRSDLVDRVSTVLSLRPTSLLPSPYLDETRSQLLALRSVAGQTLFSDLLVMSIPDSTVVVSTNAVWEGQALPDETASLLPTTGLQTVSIHSDPFIAPGGMAILTSVPMRTSITASPDAILLGINSGLRLAQLMNEMQVFWQERGVYRIERGSTFLAMRPDALISLSRYATQPEYQDGVTHPVFDSQVAGETLSLGYDNLSGTPVLGTFQWIPGWDMAIVNEVPQSDVFSGLSSLAPFTVAIVGGAALITIAVVTLTTTRLLRPLGALTTFAERIPLGDWDRRVPVTRQDEIGRLAATFNQMAAELGELYRSLEARVEERTKQMRTAAEVARDAAAIQNIDRLLDETVRLISNRFGFYHAGIFLIDETGEAAVLRAASSEGGRRMLRHGHKLAVGRVGIVGYVTGTGKPRIALDVGADAAHFSNPDLPDTRSEMGLPLRIGERVIGALDVQSEEENAFDENDVVVLQTMADQLAIAIANANLINVETRRATHRRRLIDISRQLTQQLAYSEVLSQATDSIRQAFGYERVTIALTEGSEAVVRSTSSAATIRPISLGQVFPLAQGVVGRTISLRAPIMVPDLSADPQTNLGLTPDDPLAILAVPLLSRGRAIGALFVERQQPNTLDEDDAEVLETMAGIVAVALENAHLFEETQQSLRQVDALYRRQTQEAWSELLAARMSSAVKTSFEYAQKGKGRDSQAGITPLEAPISVRGEVIGSLELAAPQVNDEWSDDDREVLEAVADEVAGALEQSRLLEEIHRRATQLRIAAEIARDITSLLDLDMLLSRVINLIRDRFGFYHVSIFLLDDAGTYAAVREATGEAGEKLKASGFRLKVGSRSVIGHVTKVCEPYVAHDSSSDTYFQPNPLLPQTRTELGLPLVSAERVIGALDVQHTRPHTFTESDITVLQILTDQLGVAIQNARSYAEALKRAQREEAVLQLSARMRESRDIDSMLQTAVHEMRKALGARHAVVRLAARLDEPPGDRSSIETLVTNRGFRKGGKSGSNPPADGQGQ